MADLLIAEELFLLTHDDESGKSRAATSQPDAALAGALLLDLAERGVMTVDEKKRVHVTDGPAGHPLVAEVQAIIGGDGKTRSITHWVSALPRKLKKMSNRIGDSLVQRGVLDRADGKALGLFATVKWPERDPLPEQQLRAGLADVLVRGVTPTAHQELLVPLLAGQNLVRTIVDKDDRKTARTTAKAMTKAAKEGKLVSAAVSQTVQATQAAVMVAVVVPATAAASN